MATDVNRAEKEAVGLAEVAPVRGHDHEHGAGGKRKTGHEDCGRPAARRYGAECEYSTSDRSDSETHLRDPEPGVIREGEDVHAVRLLLAPADCRCGAALSFGW